MSPRKRRRGGYSEGNRPYTGNALEVVSHDEPPEADQESGISEEHVSMAPKSLRSSRPSTRNGRQLATISRQKSALLLELHLKPNDLSNILSRPPVPKKKRSRSVTIARRPSSSSLAPSYLPGAYSQPFYALHDKELDELKGKPYGGILSATEADTTKTLSQPEDRRKFDNARQKAEEEWQIETANSQAALGSIRKPKKISGPASQIECINFGGFEIDTWYAAPYPEEYSRNRVLFICEYCLKYMNSEYVAKRHKMKCPAKHPPGDEIYREASISVFEVDGRKNPIYCQNLCLLAKLFLGSKTLYYDVEPFLFYVMTECDDSGCHFVGYFSKEKRPSSQNNVSCILTLPIHQRKGYGNLLIDFSYLLTRVEKKSGSPEKPLSDMGLVSYRNYWRLVLCYQLLAYKDSRKPFSVADLSESTGMTGDDIVSALEGLRALVRDPITKTYALRLDFDFFEEYIHKWESKNYVRLNPNALVWTPYVMGRNNQHMIEHAGAMNAIAARDDDDDVEMGGLTNGAITANGDIVEPASAESPRRSLKRDINGDIKRYSLPPSPTSMKSRPSLPNGVSQSTSAIPKIAIVPETAPESIPPSRFEIFPPINGRLGVARPRPIATPRLALTPRSPARRPRPSVSRRSTISKPRSAARSATSTRKRPPGGTGRGPGRWPKGTKKSDFGGADSGPGLPPRLLKEREESLKGDGGTPVKQTPNGNRKDESDSDESILYETPARRRAKAAATSARRRSALGKGKAGKGKGKARGATADSEDDFVVGDVEIEDDDDQ
jgi:histone acetyltransferase SAS3